MSIISTFYRYFFIRFIKYLLAINLFFVLLFNFIEFFEKLSHAKHASVNEILYFLALNIAPTFFEQLPISTWLTSCLLIRELYLQQELDALVLLCFSLRKLFKLFLIVGTGLAITSLFLNENFVAKLTFQAEQYRMEHFKQVSTRRLINQWMALEPNIVCYFSILNPPVNAEETQDGKDLFLMYITPQFTIQKTVSAPSFLANTKHQKLLLSDGKIFNIETNAQTKFAQFEITNPSFFSQINLHYEAPSIINLTKELVGGRHIIPDAVSNDLLGQLFKRFVLYLLLILYPALTIGLFSLFWHRPTVRWLVIFAPYPLFTITATLADHMLRHGISAWLAYLPYLICIMGTLTLYRILKRH